MKIIISPAKKMNICNDDMPYKNMPRFIDRAEQLHSILAGYTYEDLKKLLVCNDDIAKLNYERYKNMDLNRNLTPAILAYEGIQYKYMSPNIFTQDEYEYIEKHLRILSGFYGILSPFDGIVLYRLEMQAKLKNEDFNNLYDYWKDDIYNELTREDKCILNLASKEYSKIIEKYIKSTDKYVSCIFGSLKDGKIKTKATEAKMARGLMVKYLAENNIDNYEEVKKYSELGFSYSSEYSNDSEMVFLK